MTTAVNGIESIMPVNVTEKRESRTANAEENTLSSRTGSRLTSQTPSLAVSKAPSLGKLTEKFPSNYGFNEKDASQEQGKQSGLFNFLSESDKQWLVYLAVISFIVRLAFLSHPSVVIFDEVHFGGFAQKYLKREFFQDLHPPLARLLVTLSAWVGKFDANFSFYNIGADYLKPGVPYITMRAFTAVSGAIVPAISFITTRAMNLSSLTSLAVATMLIFENGLTTQSRLILLDSYLVLFTTLVALFWVLLQRQRSRYNIVRQ